MTVQYQGKSPNRLWYMWQHTKGFVKTLTSRTTRSDAKSFGKNAGIAAGLVAAAGWVAANITLLGIPSLVATAGFIAGGFFGIKAFRDARGLRQSSTHLEYIRNREKKWVEKQMRPGLGRRLKALFTRAGTVLGYGLAAAGAALATTASLQYAGVVSAAALTTVLGAAAAAVSLPVIIGVTAAAVPLGIVGAIACRRATRRILGVKPGEKKPATAARTLEARNDNSSSGVRNKSAASSFTAVTKPSAELSDERKKAALERSRRRKDGPKF